MRCLLDNFPNDVADGDRNVIPALRMSSIGILPPAGLLSADDRPPLPERPIHAVEEGL